ncbi:DUF488 domain-containing protein [Thioalkalivibrio sp. ALJ1]|uniref:DUF488 domain-containing protein n=1 Tax=Thioalkalivibrio sp. ALJ1 TaxID=1158144 RepID=UPI000570CBBC|nr:DUF488 domain-containing protein [Thioalkalivibrio sp. ALJ1]
MERVRIRRVYDPVNPDDGYRVLVDRLWPRGIKRSALALDAWEKEIAPSSELRRWFAHDPGRWRDFCRRYQKELEGAPEAWARLLAYTLHGPLTLLTATRDVDYSHTVVLRDLLDAEWAEAEPAGERASPVCFEPGSGNDTE